MAPQAAPKPKPKPKPTTQSSAATASGMDLRANRATNPGLPDMPKKIRSTAEVQQEKKEKAQKKQETEEKRRKGLIPALQILSIIRVKGGRQQDGTNSRWALSRKRVSTHSSSWSRIEEKRVGGRKMKGRMEVGGKGGNRG
ncbi:hypothetical protein B0H10DRAFT_1957138 [Mycena sp. CBHHK59/15]|nr:hypothetical protein B0H10DRAFT_1957138 [Mycena sp. CBHHK59/15]